MMCHPPAGRQWNSLITRQIQALGINFESRPLRDVVWQNKIDGDDWQLTDYGWLADYPDAENFLFLLYGPNRRPGPNLTGYNNLAYNQLFEQMRAMDDSPERLDIVFKMRAMIEEDCPLVWLQHRQNLSLYHSWLGPLKPNPIANTLLKVRSIDGPLRAQRQKEWNHPIVWPLALIVGVFCRREFAGVPGRQKTASPEGDTSCEHIASLYALINYAAC